MLEWCAKIEVKLMSRVLGRLWGHQGRLWECLGVAGVTPESSGASKLAPRAFKLTQGSSKMAPKVSQDGAKMTVRPTDRTDRPPDRPTDYIYKLPINRFSGPILAVVAVAVV